MFRNGFVCFLCLLILTSQSLAQDQENAEDKSIPTEAEIELIEEKLDVTNPVLVKGALDWLDHTTQDPELRTVFEKAIDQIAKKNIRINWTLGVLRAVWVGGVTYLAASLTPLQGSSQAQAIYPAAAAGLADGGLMVITGPLYEWYEGKRRIEYLGPLNGPRNGIGMLYRWIIMDFLYYAPVIGIGMTAGYENYKGSSDFLLQVGLATLWTTAARAPWELGVSKTMISDAEKAEAQGKRYLLPRIYFFGKLKGFTAAATTTSLVLAGKYGVPYMWIPLSLAATTGGFYWAKAIIRDTERFPLLSHNLRIGKVRNKAEQLIIKVNSKTYPYRRRLSNFCALLFHNFKNF